MMRSFHGYSSLTLLLIMLFCSFSYFHTSQVESPILMEKNIQKTNSNDVNFSAAGSEKISIIGQPIHLGDSVKASILIHNEGEVRDSVRLEITGRNNSAWLEIILKSILVQVGKYLFLLLLYIQEIMNLIGAYLVH